MKLFSAAATHQGLRRTANEDRYFADDKTGLYVVCDGMGGHREGEKAAQAACDTFVARLQAHRTRSINGDVEALCLIAANKAVVEIEGRRSHHSPGSTLTALCVGWDCGEVLSILTMPEPVFRVAHVGDSECFLLGKEGPRDGSAKTVFKKVTQDHAFPGGGLINFCGVGKDFEATVPLTRTLEVHDRYVIASDGMSRHIKPDELERIWRETPTGILPDKLIEICLERGGKDNITIIAVEVLP